MLNEFKNIFLFLSAAIAPFTYYYEPIFTILGITLMAIAIIGLSINLYYYIQTKNVKKKLKKFDLETEDVLEEIKKNREKLEDK